MGGSHLYDAIAERSRQGQRLLSHPNSALVVRKHPEEKALPGEHPSQAGLVVERSGQRFGLLHEGEVPLVLSC